MSGISETAQWLERQSVEASGEGRMQQMAVNQVSSAEQIMNSAHELDGYTRTVSDDSNTVAQNAEDLERESKNLLERIREI